MDDRARRRERRSARPPQVRLEPGLGVEVLAELGPLLADEGIDLDNLDRCDPEIVQEACCRRRCLHTRRQCSVRTARPRSLTTVHRCRGQNVALKARSGDPSSIGVCASSDRAVGAVAELAC